MAINCNGCKGYCCRVAGMLMRELDKGDGSCIFLNKDYKCDIYDHRPLICNTDRLYERYFKETYTKEQWTKMQEEACRGLHERFREEEEQIPPVEQMEEFQKRTEAKPEI